MLSAVLVQLVSGGKFKSMQRRVYRRHKARIFDLWNKYASNAKTAAQLIDVLA